MTEYLLAESSKMGWAWDREAEAHLYPLGYCWPWEKLFLSTPAASLWSDTMTYLIRTKWYYKLQVENMLS